MQLLISGDTGGGIQVEFDGAADAVDSLVHVSCTFSGHHNEVCAIRNSDLRGLVDVWPAAGNVSFNSCCFLISTTGDCSVPRHGWIDCPIVFCFARLYCEAMVS